MTFYVYGAIKADGTAITLCRYGVGGSVSKFRVNTELVFFGAFFVADDSERKPQVGRSNSSRVGVIIKVRMQVFVHVLDNSKDDVPIAGVDSVEPHVDEEGGSV